MKHDHPTPGAPAVLYAAKSTQDLRGSIETQVADCSAAIEREGRTLYGEPQRDENVSGFKRSRGPGLEEAKRLAVEAAEKHGRAELWVQHSDRLARGDGLAADHLAEVYFAMRRQGVRLRSVQDDANLEDAIRAVLIGERNTEDSRRKSEATRSGKRRRFERGQALGGPVHLGYRLVPATDADGHPAVGRDGRVAQRRVRDAQTAPTVERIFALVEQGHTFGDLARQLNAEGARTQNGKPWTTRRVRETASNAFYAGRVTAYGETVQGDHEPLIDPERFDAIQAKVRRLDPVAVRARKGGRRGGDDYLLRGIGSCARCGASLYTRSYASGRHYVCASVREARGTCDLPPIPAAYVEGEVLAHLDNFIGGLEGWLTERSRERRGERDALAVALDAERGRLADAERFRERVMAQWRRHVEAGNDRVADLVLPEVGRAERLRDEHARRCEEAEARLAEWTAAPEVDAALDYYAELRDFIAGRLRQAKSARDVNAALRDLLEHAVFDVQPIVGINGPDSRPLTGLDGLPLRQAAVLLVARRIVGPYQGRVRATSSALLNSPPALPLPARCFDDRPAEPDPSPSCRSTP